MTCHTLADAIVELARGADVAAGTAAQAEAHLEHCAACHARFVREQELTGGLRALAASTLTAEPSPVVGRRLLEAFAEHQSTERQSKTAVAAHARGYRWASIAAAAVLAVAAVAWWVLPRSEPQQPGGQPIVSRSEPAAPPTVETPGPGTRAVPSVAEVLRPRPRPRPARQARNTRTITPEGFIALPAALGLPDFESGEIVRLEIPIASLPTYGIEIPEGSRGVQVEADLLVGQDGQPRAIRVLRSLDAPGGGGGF
jgi:hypothetical protein